MGDKMSGKLYCQYMYVVPDQINNSELCAFKCDMEGRKYDCCPVNIKTRNCPAVPK